ncbi:hypothetical protein [Parapedobacter tibetensis]|uniref:hypothetical protein n=1 Tax=Parapedobacter tibetensis TaxID=2972951 RepID=UPI00214D2F67|nr:hypothetical protein [Parapedobacter tibetensis]
MLNRYLFTVFFSGILLAGYAQQEERRDERPATIDSIDVVRDYRPILADAVKIRRSPDMTNKREYQPKLTYNVLDKKLDITTGTKQLTIQEMPFTRMEDLTNNYVKIGAGNFGTLLGEAYFSTDQFVDTRIGGYVKHLNQKGSLEEQTFSQQQIGVFGRRIFDQITLNGELGFNRYATHFYGVVNDTLGMNMNPNPARQAFNDIYFTGELTSNFEENDPDAISYSLKADAYAYSNAFQAKENSVALGGYVNKRINAFNIGANISGDFTTVEDASYRLGNNIARLNPYIRFQGTNYNITLGANFVAEFGDSSRTNIFPSAEIDFALVPQFAHLFGGINGDVNKTSLRELSKENPWLSEDISIRNSLDRMHVFGGIKGNAGATFGYKVQAFYKRIESMPFYMNSPYSPYAFDVIYESGEDASTIVGLEGEVNVRVSETVSLGGKVNFNEFDLQNEEEAWFLPKMRIAANTRINISDKVYVDGELLFQGQTYGRVYDYPVDPMSPTMPTSRKVTIPTFVDISAGAEYRATKQIGVYIRLNNMLGTAYERYLFYPRLGLNVIGGVNFSF